jgi:hypothetical protein
MYPGLATRLDKVYGWILGYLDKQIGASPYASTGSCSSGGRQGTCRSDCYGMGKVWAIPGVCSGGRVCCIQFLDAPSSGRPSCTASHCGSVDPVPGSAPPCYCDSACTSNDDCCPGFETVCGGW